MPFPMSWGESALAHVCSIRTRLQSVTGSAAALGFPRNTTSSCGTSCSREVRKHRSICGALRRARNVELSDELGEGTMRQRADKKLDKAANAGRSPLRDHPDDCYDTPACAVHALLTVEKLPRRIWEPACGTGNIVKVLRRAGHDVLATD